MFEKRSGCPADPSSTGASCRRTHPGCVPGLLSDGDVEASAADAISRIDTTSGAGETGRHSNAGRLFPDHRWSTPGDAALHRAEPGAGALAAPTQPRPAAATASADLHSHLPRCFSLTQNVVETFAVPLLKTKRIPASDLPNCEGSVKLHELSSLR